MLSQPSGMVTSLSEEQPEKASDQISETVVGIERLDKDEQFLKASSSIIKSPSERETLFKLVHPEKLPVLMAVTPFGTEMLVKEVQP